MEDVLKVNAFVIERVQEVCDYIKQNIKDAGKHVTGELSDSPRPKVTGSVENINIEIEVAPFFGTIETGRKPTPGVKPSVEMIENLEDYAEAKGMSDPESAAWGMGVSINERGTQLWRDGGRDDIYSPFMTKEYWGRVREELSVVAAKNYALHLNKAKKK